jgi:hypothetical protein
MLLSLTKFIDETKYASLQKMAQYGERQIVFAVFAKTYADGETDD